MPRSRHRAVNRATSAGAASIQRGAGKPVDGTSVVHRMVSIAESFSFEMFLKRNAGGSRRSDPNEKTSSEPPADWAQRANPTLIDT